MTRLAKCLGYILVLGFIWSGKASAAVVPASNCSDVEVRRLNSAINGDIAQYLPEPVHG
jgi:hypothetical protein